MENQYIEFHNEGYWIRGTRISLDSIVYAFREGLSPETIARLQGKVRQVVGFCADPGESQEFVGLLQTPLESSELLNLVRGFVRAPLVRNSSLESPQHRRAKVVAIGSSTGSTPITPTAPAQIPAR